MSIHDPTSFDDLPLSEPIRQALADVGYVTPTDVQGGVIPLVLAGIDLIVQSQTGTGKTAAFAIPSMELIDDEPGLVQVLVLAPTRELAQQVAKEFEQVGGDALGLSVLTVYGGASISDQIRRVKQAQVVIATPGRMLDLLRRKALTLDHIRVFVLDEADEMLSMGFDKEVRAICEYLPEERQSLMFSATVTESIRDMAAYILSYPEFVSFSSDSIGAEEVDHFYYMVQGVGRLADLQRVLMFEEPGKALIFCNTRDDSFRVANYLKRLGSSAEVLNGDLPQKERELVMGQMKAGTLEYLVATDIAARGIDISFLPCVINFTLPESPESYIHRTGRTGRAGRAGEAISLISPREIGMFYQLRRAYKFDLKERKLPADDELVAVRQRRELDRILEGLDADEDLNYGRYLTFAAAFRELPDANRRLATLLAYYDREKTRAAEAAAEAAAAPVQAAREPEVEEAAPSPAEEVAPAPREEETTAVEASEVAPAHEEAKPVEASEGRGEEPAPRRRRRRRSRAATPDSDAEPVATQTAAQPPSASDEGDAEPAGDASPRGEGRRRRRRGGRRRRRGGREEAAGSTSEDGSSRTSIRVNLGRDKVDSPDRLVALLADLSGMGLEDLGPARIFDDHAIVEVREDLADDIIQAIDSERLGDYELSATR